MCSGYQKQVNFILLFFRAKLVKTSIFSDVLDICPGLYYLALSIWLCLEVAIRICSEDKSPGSIKQLYIKIGRKGYSCVSITKALYFNFATFWVKKLQAFDSPVNEICSQCIKILVEVRINHMLG